MNKDTRIKQEEKRLKQIYKDLPKDILSVYDGLIKRAAFMRIELEDYEQDLIENGYIEMFTQSEKTAPYQRERPVARLYNSLVKNYQTTIKQLTYNLPEQLFDDPAEEILKFVAAGSR